MNGRQRLWRIRRHIQAIMAQQVPRFLHGEIRYLPCFDDMADELICAELDRLRAPLQLGLWHWEV